MDAGKICCSKDSTFNFAYENELLKIKLEESEKRMLFIEKEAKNSMKILNVKITSASCNFKTSKVESPTKTNSSCQTLTSSNPPHINPSGNKVDNTSDF